MTQVIYLVFDQFNDTYSYDGTSESFDNAYLNEEDAKKRVAELNEGRLKSQPKAYHSPTKLIGGIAA